MLGDTDIKPALTAGEWAQWKEMRALGTNWRPVTFASTRPHGSAACALYGQPFGFTWEDVDFLLGVARDLDNYATMENGKLVPNADVVNLADRIAALLPPRATDA